MHNPRSLLVTLMKLKRYQEIGFYGHLLSLACHALPDVVRTGSYWLCHINIVDKFFRAYLSGEKYGCVSTVSDNMREVRQLRQEAINNNDWHIDYAGSLTADAATGSIKFVFTDGSTGDMKRAEIILHLLTHAGYHLSTCSALLEKKQLPEPPMLLTTMLGSSRGYDL